MHLTPPIAFGLVLFALALTWVPEKYRPAWTRRLDAWRRLLGLVAVIAAVLIIMNPEFIALGILGDSAFFDLLVIAISLQLQELSARVWSQTVAAFLAAKRFVKWRMYATGLMWLLICDNVVSAVQKVVHRISS